MPAVTEDVKWGADLVFSIGAKMFCVVGLTPAQTTSMSFKVGKQDFEEICARPGFVPAPYLARANWVLAENLAALRTADIEKFLTASYYLVVDGLTKKLKQELGL